MLPLILTLTCTSAPDDLSLWPQACCTSGPPCLHTSFAPGLGGDSAAGQQMPLLCIPPHGMQYGTPPPGLQMLHTRCVSQRLDTQNTLRHLVSHGFASGHSHLTALAEGVHSASSPPMMCPLPWTSQIPCCVAAFDAGPSCVAATRCHTSVGGWTQRYLSPAHSLSIR